MLIFLEHRIFEDTLLLQIIVILAFKNSSKCPATGTQAHYWKCSPLSSQLKVLPAGVVYRSPQAALTCANRATLRWLGKNRREHKSCQCSPSSPPFLLQSLFIISSLLQKLGYNCLPPSHFYLKPANVQSNTQGFQPHRRRLWLIDSGSDLWSVASTGRILRSI